MSALTAGNVKGRARKEPWVMSTSSKGTPQVVVNFEVQTSDSVELIPWYGYLSEAAFDRTVEALRYMGWQGDDLTKLDNLDANDVELVLDNDTYEGVTRLKVQWVNKLGAVVVPMEGTQAKTFAASMTARIRALDAAGGRKKATASSKPKEAPPEPPPHGDLDAPF